MKTTNHPIVKSLIDFVDNPARDFSYMDERRKKREKIGWLLNVGLIILAIGWLSVIVFLIVH